jgi:hypothetical protein
MRAWLTEANSSLSRTRSFSALGSRVERGAREDDQEPALGAAEPGRGCLLRRQHEALLREPEILRYRAHDAPDEEVEEDEEADLEAEEDRFDLDGGDGHERVKTSSVEPSVIRSPSSSFDRFSARPLTAIPFVEPRSTIQ